jgi:hypothetical protein
VPNALAPFGSNTCANAFMSLNPWYSFWCASAHSWLGRSIGSTRRHSICVARRRLISINIIWNSLDRSSWNDKCCLTSKKISQTLHLSCLCICVLLIHKTHDKNVTRRVMLNDLIRVWRKRLVVCNPCGARRYPAQDVVRWSSLSCAITLSVLYGKVCSSYWTFSFKKREADIEIWFDCWKRDINHKRKSWNGTNNNKSKLGSAWEWTVEEQIRSIGNWK